MIVGDVMTKSVLTVEPDTPVTRIAQLLVEHGVSAVPVVSAGIPIGLISESDLIARGMKRDRDGRAWLTNLFLAEQSGNPFAAAASLTAREIMTSPVLTTSDTASIEAVVEVMTAQDVKRLPVLRDGRLVGLVSRADVLRGLARDVSGKPHENGHPSRFGELLHGIDERFNHHAGPAQSAPSQTDPPSAATLTADEFRRSVARSRDLEKAHGREERERIAKRHMHDIEEALEAHFTEDAWRHMLLDARAAAGRGETELQVLRFTHEVCSDGGRAINNALPEWPTTLRGQPAEFWHRWVRELKPKGFRLEARVLDFPNGMLGDIGFFLVWGAPI